MQERCDLTCHAADRITDSTDTAFDAVDDTHDDVLAPLECPGRQRGNEADGIIEATDNRVVDAGDIAFNSVPHGIEHIRYRILDGVDHRGYGTFDAIPHCGDRILDTIDNGGDERFDGVPNCSEDRLDGIQYRCDGGLNGIPRCSQEGGNCRYNGRYNVLDAIPDCREKA